MKSFSRFWVLLSLLLVVSSWMLGINNLDLYDWDELNFAEIAREMLLSGDWLHPTVNYQPFHEKPPLFAWMQLHSFRVFGPGPFAARFPNIICGLVSALVLFFFAQKHANEKTALRWAAFFLLSLLPQLYFRSGIIDPWFNLFILLALLPVLTGKGYSLRNGLASSLFLGLAVMTKGPAAGLIAGLCWLLALLFNDQPRAYRIRQVISYGLIGLLALLPITIWVAFLWKEDDGYFAKEFLRYQWRLFRQPDAGHGGFPGYHFLVLLLGCFPASVFALPALLRKKVFNSKLDQGMRILFWVVLILFSIVTTKIVHYSSLCYLPLCWFAARAVSSGPLREKDLRLVRGGSIFIWGLYALASLSLPLLAWNLDSLLPYINDEGLLSRLELVVDWPWYTLLPFLTVLSGIVALYRYTFVDAWSLASMHLLIMGLFVAIALPCFAPRLQTYSQGELVAFYRGLQGKEVSVGTAYHKSYAHWFYSGILPDTYHSGCQDRQCRFHGSNPLPLFFSSPLNKTERVLKEVPDAHLLYQRGGYSFYQRPAQ
ncbi:ArnT family glycosyltransferase [Neolewinella agarilytica]|uniref:ArnT family glycosyltransferase n=1 Tax=Neolewinella agarilytica TaxID=478744 RepID=UPI0023537473|nr:glycosyltransferase family 39 protein [Neolewinella agarilytica]